MAWDFRIYGIDTVKFERQCFYLLLAKGLLLEQCSDFAALFHSPDRLRHWMKLDEAFWCNTGTSLRKHFEELGVEDLLDLHSKQTNFALNKMTLWYLNHFGLLHSSPLVPYENGCFIADAAQAKAILHWLQQLCAYLEQKRDPNFAIVHWDFVQDEGLLPQVKAYFEFERMEGEEYRYVFEIYYQLSRLMKQEHAYWYWEHSN